MQILKSIAPIKKTLQIIKKKKTTAITKINIENSNHLEKKETNISIILYSRREQLMQKKSHLVLEYVLYTNLASLVAQTVKNLPAMKETQAQSLGREDPLEKEMATHFSILA